MNIAARHAMPGWLASFVLWSFMAGTSAQDAPMRLRLKDGGFGQGKLVVSEQAGNLGWQAPGFELPFHFDLQSIRSVTAVPTQPGEKAKPTGQLFELREGAVLTGRLKSIDNSWVTLDSDVLGLIQVERNHVLSISDASYAGQVVYSGPIDDERWTILSKEEDWTFEAGALVASHQQAAIVGNVDLPPKAQISLVLTWKGVPDFILSFGTAIGKQGTATQETPAAARLEIWDNQLALVREVDGGADIALLSDLAGGNPRIELTVFLDQEAGTVTVCDSHGRPLDTVSAKANQPQSRTGLQIVNVGPSLTLERLEVREWDGHSTSAAPPGQSYVLDNSGDTLQGSIAGFDSEAGEFMVEVAGESAARRLAIGNLRRGDLQAIAPTPEDTKQESPNPNPPPAITQPPQLESNAQPSASTAASAAATEASSEFAGLFETEAPNEKPVAGESQPIELEVIFMDRSRVSGVWLPSSSDKLKLQVPGIVSSDGQNALQFNPQSILGIVGTNDRHQSSRSDQRIGTLKMENTELIGFLEPNSPAESTTALFWHPLSSVNASQLTADASGAVVYRKPLPKVSGPDAKAEAGNQLGNQGPVAPMVRIFLGGPLAPPLPVVPRASGVEAGSSDSNAREIAFRTGDAIDGVVERIDERGLTFRSGQTSTTFASHDQVQNIWLNKLLSSPEPSAEKLKRLMTVPRSMKNDPPTHLFVSVTGDYLRGRLVRLEGDLLSVEIRLELLEIPVSQVAQIIWLHDRDWNDQPTKDAAEAPASIINSALEPFRVHTINVGGRGLTFQPTAMLDGVISGTSELLGACASSVEQLNQLLFGRDIGERVREFREDPWTLSLAQYPKVYLDDGSSGNAGEGTQSALVGKTAPDFGLKALGGQAFRLSKQRERVVVLDFWASWCGPCMQTMPMVEEAIEEIGSDKVNLVTVNIQETERRVQAAVDRLELSSTVLLDVDGEVAAAYSANAIPQTVIIDRNGNVTHVFVGGGARFVAQFKEALRSVLEP